MPTSTTSLDFSPPKTTTITTVSSPISPSSPLSPSSPVVQLSSDLNEDRLEFSQDIIGEGSFSKVLLAVDKITKKKYALKCVSKQFQEEIDKERKGLLAACGHFNVIQLENIFEDLDSTYFVLEYGANGVLFDFIDKNGPCTLQAAQFYAAELLNALIHLKDRMVIHRDIKPENLLLDHEMHLKLTDFGTAKVLHQKKYHNKLLSISTESERKSSFVGTAQYLYPEALGNPPTCTYQSDLWGLGCIIYFLLSGKPPFTGKSEYLIFQKIKSLDYEFPTNFPKIARNIVQKLLVLDPLSRLTHEEAKKDAFFKDIDFDDLPNQLPPKLHDEAKRITRSKSEVAAKTSLTSIRNTSLALSLSFHDYIKDGKSNSSSLKSPLTPLSTPVSPKNSFGNIIPVDTPIFQKFLLSGENIVYMEKIQKRRRLSVKKRVLVLTDFPRLFYVDPSTMETKGQIPFNSLRVELKSNKSFNIVTPKRVYQFEDVESSSNWSQLINNCIHKSNYDNNNEDN